LLEWTSGADDRVFVKLESIDGKWYLGLRSVLLEARLLHWLIQGIMVQSRLRIGIIGYHYAVDSRYLRGEIGGSFPGLRQVSSYRKQMALVKKQLKRNPKEVATHASLVNARLSNMPLYIIKLFVVSRVVMRNRDGLWDRKLRRLLPHFYGYRRCYRIGGLLRFLLAEFWRRRITKPSRCRYVVGEYEIV